eukprot:gene31708-6913_t
MEAGWGPRVDGLRASARARTPARYVGRGAAGGENLGPPWRGRGGARGAYDLRRLQTFPSAWECSSYVFAHQSHSSSGSNLFQSVCSDQLKPLVKGARKQEPKARRMPSGRATAAPDMQRSPAATATSTAPARDEEQCLTISDGGARAPATTATSTALARDKEQCLTISDGDAVLSGSGTATATAVTASGTATSVVIAVAPDMQIIQYSTDSGPMSVEYCNVRPLAAFDTRTQKK